MRQGAGTKEVREGDFDECVKPHLTELFGTAVRLTGSRAEAEDLVQESALRALRFWGHFEPGTNGRAWMHRIMMNTFINRYRRTKREREILSEVAADLRAGSEHATHAHKRSLEGGGLAEEVDAAMRMLPEDFRSVVRMIDLEEQSYREVADALGCPVGTVMSRLHRARRALKQQLRAYASLSVRSPEPVPVAKAA